MGVYRGMCGWKKDCKLNFLPGYKLFHWLLTAVVLIKLKLRANFTLINNLRGTAYAYLSVCCHPHCACAHFASTPFIN